MMQHPNMNAPPPSNSQMQQQQQGASGSMMGQSFNYSAIERSQRSVFVGNIPYEATDEELKELFSQVGPVVGFRLVLDRETGKSKGYGFCEFLDQETAGSALRNMSNVEFRGRFLRIDSAAGDRSKELQMTLGAPPPQTENPYGQEIEPAKALEGISRAVASLPPEQMFELMKQMKTCVQTNPNEARNMLLQNPQLAYALLQAQVVMRIVDPQVAMKMLHRETDQGPIAPIMPQGVAPMGASAGHGPGPGLMQPPVMGLLRPPASNVAGGDMDYRGGYPPAVPNFMNMQSGGFMPQQPAQQQQSSRPPFGPPASILDRTPAAPQLQPGPLRGAVPPAASGSEEQEKAALIMQVLNLTDDQIAMLPTDQKQSVLILREQLRGGQR